MDTPLLCMIRSEVDRVIRAENSLAQAKAEVDAARYQMEVQFAKLRELEKMAEKFAAQA